MLNICKNTDPPSALRLNFLIWEVYIWPLRLQFFLRNVWHHKSSLFLSIIKVIFSLNLTQFFSHQPWTYKALHIHLNIHCDTAFFQIQFRRIHRLRHTATYLSRVQPEPDGKNIMELATMSVHHRILRAHGPRLQRLVRRKPVFTIRRRWHRSIMRPKINTFLIGWRKTIACKPGLECKKRLKASFHTLYKAYLLCQNAKFLMIGRRLRVVWVQWSADLLTARKHWQTSGWVRNW